MHKESIKNFPFQNLQSFAFEHKPTFGNIHIYSDNVEINESFNTNDLEMELNSDDEKTVKKINFDN